MGGQEEAQRAEEVRKQPERRGSGIDVRVVRTVNASDGVSPGDRGCASNTRGIVQGSAICSQCGSVKCEYRVELINL